MVDAPPAAALVPPHPILFLLGTGGVGKTTCAMLLAHSLARRDKRVLLLTVDPARRLESLQEKLALDLPGLEVLPTDVQRHFRAFVRRHAPDEKTAATIEESRFFPHLSERLQSLHEYVAGDLILEAYRSGRYDHIVVDTPPFAYAMHFLDAPRRLQQMATLAARLFATGEGGAQAVRRLSPVLARGLSYFLGRGFLVELVDFVSSFGRLWRGIAETAEATGELYRESAAYGLVMRPDSRSTDDLVHFLRERPEWLALSFVVANQVLDLPAGRMPEGMLEPLRLAADLAREPACQYYKPSQLERAGQAASRLGTLAETVASGQQAALDRLARELPELTPVRLPLVEGGVRSREDVERLSSLF